MKCVYRRRRGLQSLLVTALILGGAVLAQASGFPTAGTQFAAQRRASRGKNGLG